MEKDDKTKILVVDDSAFMRQYIIGFLNEFGFENIDEANNGQMALEKYIKTKPDIVLMDLIMPVRPGHEALEDLVAEGAKVIIVSAVGQDSVKKEMMAKGAEGFFVKPFFSGKEMYDKIQEILAVK